MKNIFRFGGLLLSFVFVLYLTFWVLLNLFVSRDSAYFDYFSDSYGITAAIGGVFGFIAAKKWGGFKSVMGQSLTLFSLGLFFQFLGQVTYAIYYYVFQIENAYPSLGDFFYFGSIPFYIFAIVRLFTVLQLQSNIHTYAKRLISVLIPLSLVSVTYYTFLIGYEFDPESWGTTLLDFGYPLGGAIILGLTLVAYLFSSSTLGGRLKANILFLFLALVVQYSADTAYLIHTMRDTWRAGGIDDLLYMASYIAMGFTLISFGKAADSFISNFNENK